jgi:hypothetical protein
LQTGDRGCRQLRESASLPGRLEGWRSRFGFDSIAQRATYLAGQVSAWKAGKRPPGPMGLMAVVAKKLSEADVRAIAEHCADPPVKAAR